HMKLSTITITKNEEATIERCLASLSFADERIVVDAESTDHTVARARAASARVVTRAWTGYGPQKNFGLAQAHGEWVLFVDADEVVPPALAREIQAVLAQPAADVCWLRIVTYFPGRPLSHLTGHNPRLFRRTAAEWS